MREIVAALRSELCAAEINAQTLTGRIIVMHDQLRLATHKADRIKAVAWSSSWSRTKPLIRKLLVDAIEDAGLTIVEANGTDAAIAAFGYRRDIGAVVTDVWMPGSMDGLGLAGWMREHQPTVPLVICSGMDTRGDFKAINPAIVRVVSKPYMPDEIAAFITTLAK